MPYSKFLDAVEFLNSQAIDWQLIGIDGWLQVGKTPLAKELARRRVCWPLDLDSFITPIDGQFLDALQLPSLGAAIIQATVPVVLSGVCLLAVMDRLEMKLDRHIYVKRFSTGIWADEDEALGNGLAAYEKRGFEPCILRNEIHNYHQAYRPHERADVLIEIDDEAYVR